jgi:hypothetical protein
VRKTIFISSSIVILVLLSSAIGCHLVYPCTDSIHELTSNDGKGAVPTLSFSELVFGGYRRRDRRQL